MTTIITFCNKLSLPVNIETWSKGTYDTILVKANTSIQVTSDTGEFFLDNIIFNKEYSDQWKASGYQPGITMGKFRSSSSYNGKNSWYIPDYFQLDYINEKNTAILTTTI